MHAYLKWDLLEYLLRALENLWPIVVKEVNQALSVGYTLEELKCVVEKGGDITNVKIRPTGAAVHKCGDRDGIPEFLIGAFHQFLLSFMVVDDQVSPL
jgi:hypothetical protein